MKMRAVMVGLLVIGVCAVAGAQNYSFSVPEMEMHNQIQLDGSVVIQYKITFHCNDGADAIDIVDVGMPNYNYDISNMMASLNGVQLSTIRDSEVVKPGVEVPLEPPIGPGETGVFEITFGIPDMVYQDTTDAEYASYQITPTWFDGSLLTDTTKLEIAVYLTKNIELDEILHQGVNFTQKFDLQDKKAVVWLLEETRVDTRHDVGVSFPKRDMEHVVSMTKLGLLWKWWTEAGTTRFFIGVLLLIGFGIFFYRFTGGTGTCLFIPLIIGTIIVWSMPILGPALEALFIPTLPVIWVLGERYTKAKRRGYLPPIESVPGGGIKRGLGVPEAAVLLEQPLGRVMTMVVFGMLKKRLITMVDDDPLTLDIVPDYRADRTERRKRAKDNGTVIRGYEQPFLDIIAENARKPVNDVDFSKAMKHLVENTAKRMSGFDLEQTKEYYLSIVSKAWQQAKEIGEIEKRDEFVDNNLLWLMMADNYTDQFDGWHQRGYHYRPAWSHVGTTSSGPAISMPTPSAPGNATSFSDVAASFAGWSQKVSGNVANSLDPISVGLVDRGGISLAGVDKVGIDILSSMAESSGSSGGGGGGGCACACAGCACACACAGGGR